MTRKTSPAAHRFLSSFLILRGNRSSGLVFPKFRWRLGVSLNASAETGAAFNTPRATGNGDAGVEALRVAVFLEWGCAIVRKWGCAIS